jgi:hypothetical protein
MPREIRQRDPEDWMLEAQRLNRIARAAALEPERSEGWRSAVAAHADALAVLIGWGPEAEAEALAAAAARMEVVNR